MHHQGSGDRDALPLAAREGSDAAPSQLVNANLVEHLFDPLTHQGRRQSQVLEAEGKLRFDVFQHELGIGMLKDKTDVASQLAGRMVAGVETTDDDAAAAPAARAVGHQPVEAAQQRRFSAP